jgi:hypothetical protein
MSQQQGSQESSDQSTDDGEHVEAVQPLQSPSSWSMHGKGRTDAGPKSEHPSTYDESIPPGSCHAQDYGQGASSPSSRTTNSTSQKPKNSRRTPNAGNTSDADAFETRYRPYNHYTRGWLVPPWARPQQNNSGVLQTLVLLIIGIMLILAFCVIITVLISLQIGILNFRLIPFTFLIVLITLLVAFTTIAMLWVTGKMERIKPPSWW